MTRSQPSTRPVSSTTATSTTVRGGAQRQGRRWWPTMTSSQVNLWLGIATTGAVITGLVSWAVGTEWARWWTVVHGTFGVMVVVLAPAKVRGSVQAGFRRRRMSRWVSTVFGVAVLTIIGLGFAHSTGIWAGVGYWTSLWTHFLLAFLVIPVFLWHLDARPSRPRAVDFNRRFLLGGGAAAGVAVGTVGLVEVANRLIGTPGSRRRFTGSHEVGSFDPDAMPTVSWIDDTAPRTPEADWELRIGGEVVDVAELRRQAQPLVAALDCTGGWWSNQRWDVVAVSSLLSAEARSFTVRSATGFTRSFPMADAAHVYLAIGYDGRPLRRGHGAPVRIVAPGRRGPWWVKWVTSVEVSDRPWWLQVPFPTT